MAAEQELGALVGRFETNNRRRGVIFIVAVLVGAVAAYLGIQLLVLLGTSSDTGTVYTAPALVAGLGLGMFGVGIWQGWLAITRPDEVFKLYEGGLVHAYAGKSRAIGWDEITKFTDQSSANPLHMAVGGNIRYRIKLVDGRRAMVITGLTENADMLAEAVREAAEDGIRPSPARH